VDNPAGFFLAATVEISKRNALPGLAIGQGTPSFSESSNVGSRRQKQPVAMQHFLKRFLEPQGHRSFLPTFSTSSLSPWTIRRPRLTSRSEG
jgi:hypothetical protein